MADLPKRELGRTGLQVTMLGYGAMELRGAPRGREVSELGQHGVAGDRVGNEENNQRRQQGHDGRHRQPGHDVARHG